ncbi:MAG: hypothetical protein LBM01_00080 [Christensenellaceae bacterium]|jgi:uncharacterized protein YjbJ (UPF0337 family)|nr:hypothetical protein [Christensenellaceae bacterium]
MGNISNLLAIPEDASIFGDFWGIIYHGICWAVYGVWWMCAQLLNIIGSIFMMLIGVETVEIKNETTGEMEKTNDIAASLMANQDVMRIFTNLVVVAFVFLIFFTIVKIIQEQYKDKEGGNPYLVVFKMFKGMVMFLIVPLAVIVGLQLCGFVFRELNNATGGGNNKDVSAAIWGAMVSGASYLDPNNTYSEDSYGWKMKQAAVGESASRIFIMATPDNDVANGETSQSLARDFNLYANETAVKKYATAAIGNGLEAGEGIVSSDTMKIIEAYFPDIRLNITFSPLVILDKLGINYGYYVIHKENIFGTKMISAINKLLPSKNNTNTQPNEESFSDIATNMGEWKFIEPATPIGGVQGESTGFYINRNNLMRTADGSLSFNAGNISNAWTSIKDKAASLTTPEFLTVLGTTVLQSIANTITAMIGSVGINVLMDNQFMKGAQDILSAVLGGFIDTDSVLFSLMGAFFDEVQIDWNISKMFGNMEGVPESFIHIGLDGYRIISGVDGGGDEQEGLVKGWDFGTIAEPMGIGVDFSIKLPDHYRRKYTGITTRPDFYINFGTLLQNIKESFDFSNGFGGWVKSFLGLDTVEGYLSGGDSGNDTLGDMSIHTTWNTNDSSKIELDPYKMAELRRRKQIIGFGEMQKVINDSSYWERWFMGRQTVYDTALMQQYLKAGNSNSTYSTFAEGDTETESGSDENMQLSFITLEDVPTAIPTATSDSGAFSVSADGVTVDETTGAVAFIGGNGSADYLDRASVSALYDPTKMNFVIGFLAIGVALEVFLNFTFGLVQRIVSLLTLFMISPITIAFFPFDDGERFKSAFVTPFYRTAISSFALIISLNVFFVIMPVMDTITYSSSGVLNFFIQCIVMVGMLTMLPKVRDLITQALGADNVDQKGFLETMKGGLKTGTLMATGAYKGAKGAFKASKSHFVQSLYGAYTGKKKAKEDLDRKMKLELENVDGLRDQRKENLNASLKEDLERAKANGDKDRVAEIEAKMQENIKKVNDISDDELRDEAKAAMIGSQEYKDAFEKTTLTRFRRKVDEDGNKTWKLEKDPNYFMKNLGKTSFGQAIGFGTNDKDSLLGKLGFQEFRDMWGTGGKTKNIIDASKRRLDFIRENKGEDMAQALRLVGMHSGALIDANKALKEAVDKVTRDGIRLEIEDKFRRANGFKAGHNFNEKEAAEINKATTKRYEELAKNNFEGLSEGAKQARKDIEDFVQGKKTVAKSPFKFDPKTEIAPSGRFEIKDFKIYADTWKTNMDNRADRATDFGDQKRELMDAVDDAFVKYNDPNAKDGRVAKIKEINARTDIGDAAKKNLIEKVEHKYARELTDAVSALDSNEIQTLKRASRGYEQISNAVTNAMADELLGQLRWAFDGLKGDLAKKLNMDGHLQDRMAEGQIGQLGEEITEAVKIIKNEKGISAEEFQRRTGFEKEMFDYLKGLKGATGDDILSTFQRFGQTASRSAGDAKGSTRAMDMQSVKNAIAVGFSTAWKQTIGTKMEALGNMYDNMETTAKGHRDEYLGKMTAGWAQIASELKDGGKNQELLEKQIRLLKENNQLTKDFDLKDLDLSAEKMASMDNSQWEAHLKAVQTVLNSTKTGNAELDRTMRQVAENAGTTAVNHIQMLEASLAQDRCKRAAFLAGGSNRILDELRLKSTRYEPRKN